MSFSGNKAEECQAKWSTLQMKWQSCRDEWQDEVADRFEGEHWAQWETSVPALLNSMADLESTIAEVESQIRSLE